MTGPWSAACATGPLTHGRTELILTARELLDRLADLVTPLRIHKYRCCGALAPNARLRRAVTESAGPAGAMLPLLHDAREKMGLPGGGLTTGNQTCHNQPVIRACRGRTGRLIFLSPMKRPSR